MRPVSGRNEDVKVDLGPLTRLGDAGRTMRDEVLRGKVIRDESVGDKSIRHEAMVTRPDKRKGETVRVALVCGTYAPRRDGVADYVRRLAGQLTKVGVDTVVAARTEVGEPDTDPGLEYAAVTPDWRWRHLGRAARAVDALGADVVHVQFAPSAYGYRPAIGWLPALLDTPS